MSDTLLKHSDLRNMSRKTLKFIHIKLKDGLKNHSAGFTLIELMIAVAIVGILSSIAVPNYVKYKEKARIVVAITDLK